MSSRAAATTTTSCCRCCCFLLLHQRSHPRPSSAGRPPCPPGSPEAKARRPSATRAAAGRAGGAGRPRRRGGRGALRERASRSAAAATRERLCFRRRRAFLLFRRRRQLGPLPRRFPRGRAWRAWRCRRWGREERRGEEKRREETGERRRSCTRLRRKKRDCCGGKSPPPLSRIMFGVRKGCGLFQVASPSKIAPNGIKTPSPRRKEGNWNRKTAMEGARKRLTQRSQRQSRRRTDEDSRFVIAPRG